jgi:lactate dehydrogenase-like 2-hydroxyacid dehydrogenase
MSARPVTVVFAEMPEAAGRDLSIERRHLPGDARIATFTYRGDREALVATCREADAILTDYVPFDRAVLGGLARCRIISVAATGWDCVDVGAAAERGIRVACIGEYCTDEVADHTLALLLALERRLLAYHRQVQEGKDWRWNAVQGVRRLAGQVLGLVGFGRIGRAVCRRALGFGMTVRGASVSRSSWPRPTSSACTATSRPAAAACSMPPRSRACAAGPSSSTSRAARSSSRRTSWTRSTAARSPARRSTCSRTTRRTSRATRSPAAPTCC